MVMLPFSLRDWLASADTGGRNAAFPWRWRAAMPICLPGKANFSKAVALQNCCLAVIADGIQPGTSQGFPPTADVGLCR